MRRERIDREVIVVGAGVVGAALALGLSRLGVDVAVVEGRPAEAFRPDDVDLRVYAISPASRALLQHLGAWDEIAALRVSPYADMRVWENDARDELHFQADLIGADELGWIVEDRLLRDVLWRALERAGIPRHCPARATAWSPGEQATTLTLDDDQTLRARLLVAADGLWSPLRDLAGIAVDATPYGERAIVAHVRCEKPHRATAWQRFTPRGPLAFLPLNDGRCSIVWSLKDAHAQQVLNMDDDAFRAAVGDAFDHRLGAIVETSGRVAFPLRLQLARSYIGPRLALVGDAAHGVHPLAGQGLNLGLIDVAALLEIIEDARARREDVGLDRVLRAYDGWRRGDAALAARAFDTLDGLFRGDRLGLPWLRRWGMGLVERSRLIKRELALHAAGRAGRVPRWSRHAN